MKFQTKHLLPHYLSVMLLHYQFGYLAAVAYVDVDLPSGLMIKPKSFAVLHSLKGFYCLRGETLSNILPVALVYFHSAL